MKRLRQLFTTMLLVQAVFAFGAGDGIAQEQEQVAFILTINGNLEARHSPNADWAPAKQRDPLYNGSQLRTGTGDKAMVIYPASGTRVLINENTTVEIQAESEGAGAKPTVERTRLLIGEIYNQARGSYEVETPSCVASVRGTEFDALSTPTMDTFVGVEGIVELMNQFGSVILNPLQMSTSQQGQGPTDPTELTYDETQNLIGWTSDVEPTWRLNLVPENGSEQSLDGTFLLSIFAFREGTIDQNATFALTEFSASSQAIEFSTDEEGPWSTTPPPTTLVNGQATVYCHVTEEGEITLTAAADDAATAALNILVTQPKERRTLELRFTDPDGTGERTMIWELEEK
jgi:hypothetical protein